MNAGNRFKFIERTSQIEEYTDESKRIYITSIDSNGLDKLIKL